MFRFVLQLTLASILLFGASISATKACDDLFISAAYGDARCVATHLAAGADPNLQDSSGDSPLHYALFPSYSPFDWEAALDVVEALLSAGGDPNRSGVDDTTPLHVAISQGEDAMEVVRVLLGGKADPNLTDSFGSSALHAATYLGESALGMVDALVNANANLYLRDNDGLTPVHIAARNGDYKIVEAFVTAGIDINLTGGHGETPLHSATLFGDRALEVVKLLLASGGDPDLPDNAGGTPLHWAASQGDKAREVVATLLASGADPNRRDSAASTPLHYAVAKRSNVPEYQAQEHLKVVELLVHAGANVISQDKDGRTALHLSVANGKLLTVKLLTVSLFNEGNAGFDLDVLDRNGETATSLARRYSGLPSRVEPEMEYRKKERQCTEEEAKRWEESRPQETWGDMVLLGTSVCPTTTIYENVYGDVLHEGDVVKVFDGIRRRFVSRAEWMRANPQKERFATSREIHRFLQSVGGDDWMEKYLIEVRNFRHDWTVRRLELGRLKMSLKQQRFDFEESRRRARRDELMAEIRRKQESAKAAELQAAAAGADEREKRKARMERLELREREERLRQLEREDIRKDQTHQVEMRRLEEEVRAAREKVQGTDAGEGGEAVEDEAQGGHGQAGTEGGHASKMVGDGALEEMEPVEGPAGGGS